MVSCIPTAPDFVVYNRFSCYQPCTHDHPIELRWFMPVNIGIVFLAGGVLGWLAVLLLRPPQHLRGLVVASCSAANFGNLLLIVIPAVCREDGNPFGGSDHDEGLCTDRGLSYASFSMAVTPISRFGSMHGS